MTVIYFNSNEEVIRFCEFLFYRNKAIDVHWKSSERWGNQLIVKKTTMDSDYEGKIAEAMVEVFMKHRMMAVVEQIIKKNYYYSDPDEIERILHVINEIVKGRYHHLAKIFTDFKEILYTMFKNNVSDSKIIYYDSFIKFKINTFKENVIQIVGLAIDEFKQEEEYQNYIHTLREYIANRPSVYSEVHVIQGKQFTFYQSNGRAFSQNEIKKLMMKEPLYIVGLDHNEWNLAPLIAMSPQKIYIYGHNSSEPKTLSLINIFQERVIFKAVNQFPFSSFIKKT